MRSAVERGDFVFLVIGIDEYVYTHIVKLRVIAYSETRIYSVYLKAGDIVWFLQWSQSIGRVHNTSFTVTGVHVLLLFSRMARW